MSQPPPGLSASTHFELPPLGRPARRRRALPLLLAAGLLAVVALVILHDDVRYYRVTSGSMQPTLAIGTRVAAEAGVPVRLGEIVVLHAPAGAASAVPVCGTAGQGAGFPRPCGRAVPQLSSVILIKRVVAGPGDLVSIDAGRAVVNGTVASEPFVALCAGTPSCTFPVPVRIPSGQYFLLGDNRRASDDSRFWGPVPADWILGVVVHCGPLQTACRPVH